MKKALTCFIMCFVTNVLCAQHFSIKGKVIDEDSVAVVSANVVLQNANTQVVLGAETNTLGEFAVQNITAGSGYKLTISYMGYENQEFEFENISQNIDLQTVILFKSAFQLEGAEVKSAKTKITEDRRIVYPTQQQLQITADGVSLLNAMKLPLLSVVPGTTEITYWGRGGFKFYINENEATNRQILALAPSDVLRIEYIDRPSIEYGAGVGLVIKYVTKKTDRGMTNSINISKPLNRNSGDLSIESRVNYKNSEFGLSYDAGYSKSKHFNLTTTDETFYLNSGTLHRNEIQTGAKGSGVNNNIALAYNYSNPEKEHFYIKTEYSSYNNPTGYSDFVLYNSGIRNDTTNKHSISSLKNGTFSAVASFTKHFGKKQYLRLYSSFYRQLSESNSSYTETDNSHSVINHIWHNIDAEGQSAFFYALHNINFSDALTLTTSLNHQISNTKNIDTGTGSSFSNVRQVFTYLDGQLSANVGQFYIDLYLVLLRRYVNISGQERYTRIEFEPSVSGRYVFNDRNYIGFYLNFVSVRPKFSQMNTSVYVIDEIQLRRGNTNLKTGYAFYPGINGNTGLGIFNISWWAGFNFSKNAVWEHTYIENNTVVRMPANVNSIKAFKSEMEISPDLFDWLSMSVALGYNRYENRGSDYSHTYNNPYVRFNASASWKRWTLSSVMWNHNNEFYGETMFTSGRSIMITLMRTWFNSRLATSLTLYTPFSKNYSKQGTVNHSRIAPYENWMHYTSSFRMLTLNISYKFNVGRKTSSDSNIKTGVSTGTGTINTDKSAAQNK